MRAQRERDERSPRTGDSATKKRPEREDSATQKQPLGDGLCDARSERFENLGSHGKEERVEWVIGKSARVLEVASGTLVLALAQERRSAGPDSLASQRHIHSDAEDMGTGMAQPGSWPP